MAAALRALLVLALVAVPAAIATDYTVGDSSGWGTGVDYSTWATGKTFKVGDTLVFQYGGLHSVAEVSQSDYQSCSASNSLSSYSDGNTQIKLTAPGTRYFICGTLGHCSQGMQLAIPVTGSASSSGPDSTSTPSTPTVTTPHGGTPLTRPSSYEPSGAATGNAFSLLLLVLLAGLMGVLLV